ncbi:MAG: hypothetical protein R3F60_13250 [bacterium]
MQRQVAAAEKELQKVWFEQAQDELKPLESELAGFSAWVTRLSADTSSEVPDLLAEADVVLKAAQGEVNSLDIKADLGPVATHAHFVAFQFQAAQLGRLLPALARAKQATDIPELRQLHGRLMSLQWAYQEAVSRPGADPQLAGGLRLLEAGDPLSPQLVLHLLDMAMGAVEAAPVAGAAGTEPPFDHAVHLRELSRLLAGLSTDRAAVDWEGRGRTDSVWTPDRQAQLNAALDRLGALLGDVERGTLTAKNLRGLVEALETEAGGLRHTIREAVATTRVFGEPCLQRRDCAAGLTCRDQNPRLCTYDQAPLEELGELWADGDWQALLGHPAAADPDPRIRAILALPRRLEAYRLAWVRAADRGNMGELRPLFRPGIARIAGKSTEAYFREWDDRASKRLAFHLTIEDLKIRPLVGGVHAVHEPVSARRHGQGGSHQGPRLGPGHRGRVGHHRPAAHRWPVAAPLHATTRSHR